MSRKSPKYGKWRKRVLGRDGWKCRLCAAKTNLEVHHIKRYANNPKLRHVTQNGIVLCKSCHAKIYGREELYEKAFESILYAGDQVKIDIIRKRYGK